MLLSRDFVSGLQEERRVRGVDAAMVEECHLAKADIRPCKGCFSCWKGGKGSCVIKDDMSSLLPRFCSADLVIWSMPLYHFGMPALMKGFVERTLPGVHGEIVDDGRGAFTHPPREDHPSRDGNGSRDDKISSEGKKAFTRNILISSCGFPSRLNNYEALHAHLDQLWGRGAWERIECVEGELLGIPAMNAYSAPYRQAMRTAGSAWAVARSEGREWRGFSPELRTILDRPMLEEKTFLKLANANWGVPGSDPLASGASIAEGAGGIPSLTQKREEAGIFLRQMAILFNPAKAPPEPAVLEMRFTDLERSWFFLMKNAECLVLDDAPEGGVTTTIHTSYELWQKISRGEVDGSTAMMQGLYRVSGDGDLLMRMADGLFSGAPQVTDTEAMLAPSATEKESRPQGLFFALLPWLIGWVGLPLVNRLPLNWTLSLMLGASAVVLSRSAGRKASTWFERINPLCMVLFILAGFIFPDFLRLYGAPLLYAASALLWGLSAFRRPLTSDYSAPDYPAAIRAHPIFRGTNRVMTLFWAGVFFIQAALAFLLGFSTLRPYTGLILQAVLVPALVFTRWFPAWYSAKRMGLGGKT